MFTSIPAHLQGALNIRIATYLSLDSKPKNFELKVVTGVKFFDEKNTPVSIQQQSEIKTQKEEEPSLFCGCIPRFWR
jgi:hypothetical protein